MFSYRKVPILYFLYKKYFGDASSDIEVLVPTITTSVLYGCTNNSSEDENAYIDYILRTVPESGYNSSKRRWWTKEIRRGFIVRCSIKVEATASYGATLSSGNIGGILFVKYSTSSNVAIYISSPSSPLVTKTPSSYIDFRIYSINGGRKVFIDDVEYDVSSHSFDIDFEFSTYIMALSGAGRVNDMARISVKNLEIIEL